MLKHLGAMAAGLVIAIVLPVAAMAQTVTTPPWLTNGNNGLMFDVQATNDLTVTNITDAVLSANPGGSTFELYSRPGTYVGNAASSAGWELISTGSATATGANRLSFTLNAAIPAGQTRAFYLRGVNASVGYVNGTQSSPWASDANLAITEGGGLTDFFGGITNSPRALGGSITYTP